MAKWLLAWWFAYAITNAAGEPVIGQVVTNLDSEVVCNRVLGVTQTFYLGLLSGLPRWGSHFTTCLPDAVDRRPR